MTVPVFLPADAEIDESEISAINRSQAFESETKYLLRETRNNDQFVAWFVYGLLLLVFVAWIAAFTVGAARLARPERRRSASTKTSVPA
jgi:hypothetical protein